MNVKTHSMTPIQSKPMIDVVRDDGIVLKRRTQEMRSAAMRTKLIEATLDALHGDGYFRTTLKDIASRAGVSRGALMHHFNSKDDLIAHAIDHMLKDATIEISSLSESVNNGALNFESFLDRLWHMFSGRLMFVTLEHVNESRHNEILHMKLVPLVKDFHEALDRIWRIFFDESKLKSGTVSAALNATLCFLRGMAVQMILRDDPAYYRCLLVLWRKQIESLLAAKEVKQ